MSRKPGDLITLDPSDDVPEGFDYTAWLAELGTGVLIATSTWAIVDVTGVESPALLTYHDAVIVLGSLKTQAFFKTPTDGVNYMVTNHVETNSSPPAKTDKSFFVLGQQG